MKKIPLLLLIMIFISSIYLYSCKEIKVNNIYNNVIFIDPGHGGKDNGTSYNDILEDELNLKLSTILYEMILDDGGICYLSRIADYDLSSMYSKNHKLDDLNKRIKYIDSLNTSLFVSLHLNYYPNSKVNGIQVFYQKNNENSYNLAYILQNQLNEENIRKKKCFVGDYYLLNNTKSTGVLIEYGFLSSEYDRNKLLKDSYLKYLATLIKKGINEYLNTYCK